MERLRAVTGQINFCLKFSAVCVEVWKKRGLPCRLDHFVVYKAEAQKQLAVGRRIALNLVVKSGSNSRSVRFILRKRPIRLARRPLAPLFPSGR
jgi:hypothetical protein